MARTRTVVTEELPEVTELELDQDATFAEILGELNAAPDDVLYTGTVHEVPVRPDGTAVKGSKEIFLFDVDQSQFAGLNEYLRDNVGTGTYRVRVKKNGILVKNTTLRVKKIGLPALQTNDNALSPVVERLMTRLERLEERLTQTPQTTEMDRLKTMSEIMKNLRGDEPRGAAPAQNESATIASSVGLISTVFAMAEKIFKQPASVPEGSSWQDVAVAFLQNGGVDALKQGVIPARTNPASPETATPGASPQRRISVQQPETPAEIPAQDMVRIPIGNGQFLNIPAAIHARLNETVITLCRRARTNQADAQRSQPYGYVDFTLDELDDIDSTGALQMQLVGNENSLALLMEAFPATVPYKDWFAELLAECRKAIEGDATTVTCCADCLAGQTAGHDAGDSQNHAPIDPAGQA